MTQSTLGPEYTQAEKLAEISHQWDHGKTSNQISLVQVEAELRLLSVELDLSVDILGKIRDSVRVLEQSVQEHM